jgi:hypothetical protein
MTNFFLVYITVGGAPRPIQIGYFRKTLSLLSLNSIEESSSSTPKYRIQTGLGSDAWVPMVKLAHSNLNLRFGMDVCIYLNLF